MLKCQNLRKKFIKKTAVEDITLELEEGRIYALLGPNGSGKTTFMKMIAGLVKPSQGELLYKNQLIGIESKKEVAYMSTEPYFYNFMTVEDVGKYYQDFFADFDMETYKRMISEMELDVKDKVGKISSGMMAKVKLAATLSRKAKLYLLDEPLNGIDLIAREKIISTILSVAAEDNTIVLSSHLVEELETVVDGVIFIKDGKNVLNGDAETIREEQGKSIVDIYKEIYA
ncbi:MAG: ABC transporter ATP-binding protein [Lachnospiraceae bacterium]|nr:ABC transporter ATP-binding protein [Lachnospiraceae bacterium]